MASKGIEVKKSTNTKSILSQSNGTVDKTSPKSALLKSPTAVKTSPKSSSTLKNGTTSDSSSKLTNGSGIKKMEAGSPPIVSRPPSPKLARSPSAKTTPPIKTLKTVAENGFKTNGLERKNSHGDAAVVSAKSDLIVDNGVVHSTGLCEAMLSVESKLKENHFALESADNACPKVVLTVDSESAATAASEDALVADYEIPTVFTEQELASGDKACVVKDKSETSTTTSITKQDSVDEKFEDAKSDLNDTIVIANGSPDSDATGSTKSSTETVFAKDPSTAEEQTPDSETPAEPEVTKQSIRMKVWDHLEKNDLVVFPRPCQGRIPNFKGAPAAAEKLIGLEVFKNSKTIKVNPDKPQEMVRFHTLEFGKRLLVPVPRLRDGLFQSVVPPAEASKYQLRQASQRFGMKRWSRPISSDENVSIDLIVLGSVAVDKKGHRLGKGEGFADLEFAVLMKMNAINENTVIVTTVHDDQVHDELPEHLFKEHDVPVDLIVTPTQVIEIKEKLPRPTKILWNILSNRRILEIPIVQTLREEELKEGNDCTLKDTDSDVEERPYIQRFTRRRRFNYSRATGDPLRDNKMYPVGPPRQYFYRVPRGPYMHQTAPPPPNRMNNYGPPMMRNEPRRGYYGPNQPSDRPQRMRPTRPRSMSRGNRQQMHRPQSTGRPRSQNRSRSMNRSLSMNGPNMPASRSRRQSAIDYHHAEGHQYPMNQSHITNKSVEVQTVNKSKSNRSFVKRKRAPIEFSLRVKNIGMGVRVRDLKVALNERGIKPRDITWRGYKGFAFLHFVKPAGKENNPCLNVEEVIKTLKDLPLAPKDKKMLVIEPLKGKRESGEGAVAREDGSVDVKETTTEVASVTTIAT